MSHAYRTVAPDCGTTMKAVDCLPINPMGWVPAATRCGVTAKALWLPDRGVFRACPDRVCQRPAVICRSEIGGI